MTTLTLRRIRDGFLVTGPDIAPAKFKTRREAKDWCADHYPGSSITEIGASRSKRIVALAKGSEMVCRELIGTILLDCPG